MQQSEITRERGLRGRVERLGYKLRKSRGRASRLPHFGGYMIVDPEHNALVSLDIDDVEAWLRSNE
jgi:hypothetical protein